MKLRFTYRAAGDLQRLRAFIAKDNPLTAPHKIDALRRPIRVLLDQPTWGARSRRQPTCIMWIAGEYIARYFADEQFLTVNRIWHSKEGRASP